jgi:translation initiation factor 1 (eIF-1/SUI1)
MDWPTNPTQLAKIPIMHDTKAHFWWPKLCLVESIDSSVVPAKRMAMQMENVCAAAGCVRSRSVMTVTFAPANIVHKKTTYVETKPR